MTNDLSLRAAEAGREIFEQGVQATAGELHVITKDPFAEVQGVESEIDTAENGYQHIEFALRDLPSRRDIWGRVLLMPVDGQGDLPVVFWPAPQKEGQPHNPYHFKMAIFNEPFNPNDPNGLDEGKLIALSYDTMTTESAGYGSHGHEKAGKSVGFEGAHFGVAAQATKSAEVASGIKKHGDKASHVVLGQSAVARLRAANLLPPDMPTPTINNFQDVRALLTVDKRPVSMQFRWYETMVDGQGNPLQANHEEATTVLTGNMISTLGKKGLNATGEFVVHASKVAA